MRSSLIRSLFASLTLVACAPVDDAALDADDPAVDEVRATSVNLTYYYLRPDYRRCVSPLCGGYFIRRPNQPQTKCVDGTWQRECYVAQVDLEGLGADAHVGAGAIVRGRIAPRSFGSFGTMGVLVASGAWRPVAETEASGSAYSLRDNGIRCFRAPCPTLEATYLNRTVAPLTLTGLDTSRLTGASSEDLAAARQAIADGGSRVLAAGSVQAEAGGGRVLRASQLWLAVGTSVPEDLFCTAESECARSVYTREVGSRADCYCPFCPTTVANTATVTRYERSYNPTCRSFRETCPVPRCVAPAPIGCVANRCQTVLR